MGRNGKSDKNELHVRRLVDGIIQEAAAKAKVAAPETCHSCRCLPISSQT